MRNSTIMTKVEQYLEHKRSLGYKMKTEDGQLRSFARYVELHAPAGPLTSDLALRWATSPKGTRRFYHALRLGFVRSFARYLAVFDPRTEIPPQRLLCATAMRAPPYIYKRREITALIRDVLIRPPTLRCDPYIGQRNATTIGLLACTGMRIGEVLALKNRDLDLNQNVITVRQSKNLPMRLVPISDSASRHLQQYRKVRDRRFGNSDDSGAFICSLRGGHSMHGPIWLAFRKSRKHLGLGNGTRRKPRLHDLRHTFACNHLLRAYRENR
ncbi:MAG: tyrosine-type recombinase/integrase, partial [Phycisphaerales bacterium]|nr:tyrosine-type recombinase/integrase [Phycisphaerales bacterium]